MPDDAAPFDALRRRMPAMPAVVPGEDAELDEGSEHPASEPSTTAPLTDAFDEPTARLQLQVVEDLSGRPLADVRLAFVLPGGEELRVATDAAGQVVREGLHAGAVQATSEFRDRRRDQTWAVVSLGAGEPSTLAALETDGPQALATLSNHRVATGETLEALAEGAGLQTAELSRFLWGTAQAERVQEHLRDDVGCTRQDAGGYVFDDSDDPGTLCLPGDWSTDELSLDSWQILRVAREPPACRLSIAFLLGAPGQVAEDHPRYVLESQDGSYREERSAQDDLVEGDAYLQLAFEDLDPSALYTLTRVGADGRAEVVFHEQLGAQVCDQARAAARGLCAGAFTGLLGLHDVALVGGAPDVVKPDPAS